MANEVFQTLKIAGTGAGAALVARAAGDAPSTHHGSIALAFRDSAGNLVLPQLDAAGALPVVVNETAGNHVRDRGVATPGALNTDTDVAIITLTASTTYRIQGFSGSAFQPCTWRLELNDNGTPEILADFVTGSGAFNYATDISCIEFTSGATGTQELKLIVQQLQGPLSPARGFVCALELA